MCETSEHVFYGIFNEAVAFVIQDDYESLIIVESFRVLLRCFTVIHGGKLLYLHSVIRDVNSAPPPPNHYAPSKYLHVRERSVVLDDKHCSLYY
jgi:hypothetical protein